MPKNGSPQNRTLFPTPFSKAYWRQAASEFRDLKMLLFAALVVALRVALKSVSIPIAADLRIGVGFFVNAFGAMIYGPVVAAAGAAVSDTLGALLFPSGPYFPLYSTRVTALRVILSRFCIDFFVNIVLNTPVMMAYYSVMLGKSYKVLHWPRIVKNLAMFPLESVLLILFLRAVIPAVKPLGSVPGDLSQLRFTRKNIILLAVFTVIGVAAVILYAVTR